ncbi:MAG: alanine--tRNA ligase [Candidatus Taylorbacteria bacterium]|nr:alanine--tRNA ligase [Candidatus Taylorbacteria bacterium]
MKSQEIRLKYLNFFKKRGHVVIPSASLVPQNDPTTLFTGSGMQPILPYLLGQPHPEGTRVVDSQKCFRSVDIDEIGDNRHHTFFEMLGNWSFGDYFKEDQLHWFFEFLTDELHIDPRRLYVTVYAGHNDYDIPKDSESVKIWKELFASRNIDTKDVELVTEENAAKVGMQGGRIFYYGNKNWWSRSGIPEKMPTGEPGGPDSEVFFELKSVEHNPEFGTHCHPNCDCGRFIEIGNSVFMEYRKNSQGAFEKLPQRNVDYGGGFERIVMAATNTSDTFLLDVFQNIIHTLQRESGFSYSDPNYQKSMRVISDHLRAAAFLIGDGVIPSNTDQGYFVRRLIRRAVRHLDLLGIKNHDLAHLVPTLLAYYEEAYPETFKKRFEISDEISREEGKFRETLKHGLKEFEKGVDAFTLFSSYGFPFELTLELAKEKGIKIDIKDFEEKFRKHQELSRAGSEQKFKGGLADTSDISLRYHTATHLLHQALYDVLGSGIAQKGSNITPERLRFDFAYPTKMTEEQKKKVEDIVNEKIKEGLPMQSVVLPKEEALKTGAKHFFGEKYGEQVSVYFIGKDLQSAYSKEFCGGPHVSSTSTLGQFKIIKEEAVSAGVRRIKAVLVV